jgi:hypothetical protein
MTDSKPEQISRKEWAEQQARKNGYTGAWPPRAVPTPISVDQLREYNAKIELGDARTSLIAAAGRGVERFVLAISPADCAGFARTIKGVIDDPTNAARSRMIACKQLLRPVLKILEMATE